MKEAPKRNKGGRPKISIDPDLVEKLAGIGCPNREIAAVAGCSVDTLARRFADVIDKGRENCKTRLRKKQIEVALAGNVSMLIFLGKNMLGQSDKTLTEISGPDGGPIQTEGEFRPSPKDEEVIRRIAEARARITHREDA